MKLITETVEMNQFIPGEYNVFDKVASSRSQRGRL